MAKGIKITATFSNGAVMSRTTTLNLTHAWVVLGLAHPDNAGHRANGNREISMSGFSGSLDKAQKAVAAEVNTISKPNYWNNKKAGEIVSTEIVAVAHVADKVAAS